jgi:uncharacterized protein DUF6883
MAGGEEHTRCAEAVVPRFETMKLPHADQAIVPEPKLTGYLLSPTHRVGRAKAAFFQRFGFTAANWVVLAESLRQHARENEIATREVTPFGVRYTVEGPLRAPDGRAPLVRVVWFVENTQTIPHLATAYPL